MGKRGGTVEYMRLLINDNSIYFLFVEGGILVKSLSNNDYDLKAFFGSEEELKSHFKVNKYDQINEKHLIDSDLTRIDER